MSIKEPLDPSGLWAAVKPLTEWPASDEGLLRDLGTAWDTAGNAFDKASGIPSDGRLVNGWSDGNGEMFRSKIAKLRGLVFDDSVRMKHAGWLATSYGEDVAYTKSEITRVIYENARVYSNTSSLFGRLMGVTGGKEMVEEIAGSINDFLALMADRIRARGRGDAEPPRPQLDVGPFELGPEEGPPELGGVGPNWSPKSTPTFGHTFSRHGGGPKNTDALIGRAAGTGKPQGQWIDDEAAAKFLREIHVPDGQTRIVRLPDGLGRVILPDGTIVPAKWATVVVRPNGLYKDAYPIPE